MTSGLDFARVSHRAGLGKQCNLSPDHGAQHEAPFAGGDLFHAFMRRCLRGAGCFGRGAPGWHCGHLAR